ncbi:MAG TPA: hypothetical protein VHJ76_01015 [Actinomycetota bacterium]|nr:hypothetical protein [Actinomycetota bacterium]
MLGKTKRLVAAVAATAAIAGAAPATAAGSDDLMAACQVKPLFSVIEWQQTVLLYGVYAGPQGSTDVQLVCGIVRNGVTVAKHGEKIPGPVAALAATPTVPAGSIGACYEIRVTHLSGLTTNHDTCP